MAHDQNRKKSSLTQMRMASIGALFITLTILGVIALIRITATGIEHHVKEQMSFSIELPKHYNEESFRILKPELERIRAIKHITFISADSALAQISRNLGEDPNAILGDNPLFPVLQLELHANYLDTDSLKVVEKELANIGIGATLNYEKEQITQLNKNITLAEGILWALVALQALFAFIQVNNTIRMMIHAERLQIRTLTLVGASRWFICKPIIGRSLLDGLISSLLSIGVIAGIIYGLDRGVDVKLWPLLDVPALIIASIGLILIALVACFLASAKATLRYINMNGSRIHLI